jgi:hypothetical protein
MHAQGTLGPHHILCSPLLWGFVGLAYAGFLVGITQWLAKRLGGTGSYAQLFLLVSATFSPIFILTGIPYFISSFIPWVAWVATALWVYAYVLTIMPRTRECVACRFPMSQQERIPDRNYYVK